LLLVDKPAGLTSHDVVDRVRRHFKLRKVGHGGTLDPMATGLLVLLLGRGTRISARVMVADKTYEGTLHLGVTTDTDDADGRVTGRQEAGGVTREALEREMEKWRGDLQQVPPMVSAIKINGVPLYKLARKGQIVDREPRLIHIYEMALLDFQPPRVRFRLRCSKGTYVRTIAGDIGRDLGCGAHLEQLRRTRSGALRIEDAVALDRLAELDLDGLVPLVIPLRTIRPEDLDR
jgi:tRNA pseudouridine55 synthase